MPLDAASFTTLDQNAKDYHGHAMAKELAAIPMPEHLAIIRQLAEKEKDNKNLSFVFADYNMPYHYEYLIIRNLPIVGTPGKTKQVPLLDERFAQTVDLAHLNGGNSSKTLSWDQSNATAATAN